MYFVSQSEPPNEQQQRKIFALQASYQNHLTGFDWMCQCLAQAAAQNCRHSIVVLEEEIYFGLHGSNANPILVYALNTNNCSLFAQSKKGVRWSVSSDIHCGKVFCLNTSEGIFSCFTLDNSALRETIQISYMRNGVRYLLVWSAFAHSMHIQA